MAKELGIADFYSVSYNKENDDVFITFKVIDPKYKDFVMRWGARKDGRLIIRGEKLIVIERESEDASV